jgi:hypothetical protein
MRKLKFLGLILVVAMLVFPTAAVSAGAGGIDDPGGVPLYVIIEVNWDGVPGHAGDWTVYGPVWEPVVGGTVLSACTACLELNYDFTFRGNTVQFDETMVDTVEATPQSMHVVLRDMDGDGTYTGSESAMHYFAWGGGDAILYFDRIDYTVTFDSGGNVTSFHYLHYEHKKLP